MCNVNDESVGARSLVPTMLGSAMAGMIARVPTHPIDTCKAKMQVVARSAEMSSVWRCLWSTYRVEGVRGLYAGFGSAFYGSAPAMMLYFTSFETAKSLAHQYIPVVDQNPFIGHFFAGLIAETFSCLAWVPIDVVKERLQVQSSIPGDSRGATNIHYRGNLDALRVIIHTEGLRGIYRGYGATIASFGPFSAFYLMFYEQLKSLAMTSLGANTEQEVPISAFLLSGTVSGGLAAFITNPLDMAKLRIQVQRGPKAFDFGYRNIFHGLSEMYRAEGVRGFFRGAGARVAFHAPSAAITIAAYEECKLFFQRSLYVS